MIFNYLRQKYFKDLCKYVFENILLYRQNEHYIHFIDIVIMSKDAHLSRDAHRGNVYLNFELEFKINDLEIEITFN